ncbi:MAG: T9SS C-terminal target domain-containing protein [Flavobacteriales bacterium]|nr:T9SS C-terminal target domain-containing protein [Flavobacteriales bacterium]
MSMKKYLLFFLILSALRFTYSQVKLDALDRDDLKLIQNKLLKQNWEANEAQLERYPITKIKQKFYFSFLGKINQQFNPQNLSDLGIMVGKPIGSVVSLKVPLNQLATITSLPGLESMQIAAKVENLLDKAIIDIRADSTHAGIGLPEGYTGKDVYIGVTDWGFDYTSPMFYDTSLSESRIIAAWDQFKTSGPSPNGFDYGTEYTSPQSLLSAECDTSNVYNYGTHGTHVAGIAAGSGAGLAYRGVAFESKLLFVTFTINVASVLDAWEWMYQKALADGKRLVINMSWGIYHFGTLDGTSLLSQAITAYTDLGVIFINSGGNNGNVNFHLKKTFSNDVLKSKIDFYDYNANANMWGQSIHSWGEVGNNFSNGLIVTNSAGLVLVESPYYATNNTPSYIDTFIVAGLDTVWYNISADAIHPLNNKPQMRLRVKNTNTSLKILLKSIADTGIVHYWNLTELTNGVGNWGMPFSTSGSGTSAGNNLNGISEPACSDDVITVAAYATQYSAANGSLVGGGIASFSSIGPRYDGTMKPDISAPGVAIMSSISSFTNAAYTSMGSVDFNGRTYHFAKFSGTSMSSPMVAGVAALILDANPYLSARQVKEIIMETARQDNITGIIPVEGSTRWGAGRVNAYAAVKLALQTIGLEEPANDLMWSVFPNPVANELHFTIVDELPKQAEIVNLNGQANLRAIINGKLNVSDLSPGNYFIRLQIKGKIEQLQFTKQ